MLQDTNCRKTRENFSNFPTKQAHTKGKIYALGAANIREKPLTRKSQYALGESKSLSNSKRRKTLTRKFCSIGLKGKSREKVCHKKNEVK